jgi:hypothetical protein
MPSYPPQANAIVGSVRSALNHKTIMNRVASYHVNLFSTALLTWYGTIDDGHFTTWPGLTLEQVHIFPPQSSIMHKGHFDQRANHCPIRVTPEADINDQQPYVETRQQLEYARYELEDAREDS